MRSQTATLAVHFSPIESRRFGMRILRGHLRTIDGDELLRQLIAERADIAVMRTPTDGLSEVAKLAYVGIPFLVADTLVYYEADLVRQTANPLKNPDLEFVLAQEGQAGDLERIVTEAFASYTNHYTSNPFLDRLAIFEGYKEWATSYVGPDPYRDCWIIRKGSVASGFVTCALNATDRTAEIILNAVLPSASGQGLYSDALRFLQAHYQAQGYVRMRISTQIQNTRVQGVWAREGFHLVESFVTLHLNAFLDFAHQRVQRPLRITRESLGTSDTGPDRQGPSVQVSDDVLFAEVLAARTMLLGPNGGRVTSCFFKRLAEIRLDHEYALETALFAKGDAGHPDRLRFTLSDTQGQACLIGYAEVTA